MVEPGAGCLIAMPPSNPSPPPPPASAPVKDTAGSGRWREFFFGERGLPRLFFYLPLGFMVLFLVVPMALTLVWSVFPRDRFWMKPGFTLVAYEKFFDSGRIDTFIASIYHSGISVVVAFVIGFPIAVFVRRRIPLRAQHAVMLLFILPFMVSELIRTFALRPVLGRTGLVNNTLVNLGIISEPISIILYSPLATIIGEVMSFLPFLIFASFLAMEAVERYVFEVCDDLGSRGFNLFKDILIPLAAPGIFAGSLFIFVNGIGLYIIPFLLGGPAAANAGVIVTNAIGGLDYPLAMAISVIMMTLMIGLLYLGHRLFDLTRILEPIRR